MPSRLLWNPSQTERRGTASASPLDSRPFAEQKGKRRTHVTAELSISDGLDADGLLLGNLVLDSEVLDLLEVGASAVAGVEVLALLEEIKRACRKSTGSVEFCSTIRLASTYA